PPEKILEKSSSNMLEAKKSDFLPCHQMNTLIRDTYMPAVALLDLEIWWEIIQNASIKDTSSDLYPTKQYLHKKKQLVQTSVRKKNNDTVCQNCRKIGNRTERFYFKAPGKASITNVDNTLNKAEKSMLALSSASETKNIQHNIVEILSPIDEQILAAPENKRIRVEDLLNNHNTGTIRNISMENSYQKPTVIINRKPCRQSKKTFGNFHSPIGNAELFKLKSELLRSINKEIKTLGQNSAKSYFLYNINRKDEGIKTFILTKIANKDISISIDIRAINPIIDYNVLVALNVTPENLNTPHYIKTVGGGAKIALDHCVCLDVLLEED
ncbi:hypothetical protein BB561_007016, partial [Smittium simulii]